MKTIPQIGLADPVEMLDHIELSDDGNLDRMPIMISMLMPFPMPFSVMRSPSHIRNIVPVVKAMTVVT